MGESQRLGYHGHDQRRKDDSEGRRGSGGRLKEVATEVGEAEGTRCNCPIVKRFDLNFTTAYPANYPPHCIFDCWSPLCTIPSKINIQAIHKHI
jgi:hypothetical protein